jgi:hypothetical protein
VILNFLEVEIIRVLRVAAIFSLPTDVLVKSCLDVGWRILLPLDFIQPFLASRGKVFTCHTARRKTMREGRKVANMMC